MALTADLWARGGKAVELISDAFVVRINTDAQSTARSVTWRIGRTGDKVTEKAQVIVMACGAIETPRLWLMSDLPNPNEWVGCGLTDHHFDTIIGVMPFDTGSSKGPGSAARADFPGYGMLENTGATPAGQASVFTFSDAGIAGFYDNGALGDAHGADGVGRLVGAELKSAMSYVDRLLSIAVLTDDDVEKQNRVTLPQRPTSTAKSHGWRYTSGPVPSGRKKIESTLSSRQCDSCRPPGRARCIESTLRPGCITSTRRCGWA